MKTIELKSRHYYINLTVDPDNPGAGKIESDIERFTCPCCGLPDCCFNCDESTAGDSLNESEKMSESEDDVATRLKRNGAIDGIEAMILAHACLDINVTTPAYLEGIETAVNIVLGYVSK